MGGRERSVYPAVRARRDPGIRASQSARAALEGDKARARSKAERNDRSRRSDHSEQKAVGSRDFVLESRMFPTYSCRDVYVKARCSLVRWTPIGLVHSSDLGAQHVVRGGDHVAHCQRREYRWRFCRARSRGERERLLEQRWEPCAWQSAKRRTRRGLERAAKSRTRFGLAAIPSER